MAEENGKRGQYVPKNERDKAKTSQPEGQGTSRGFPTPQMDTSKYRKPPKPQNRNDRLLMGLGILVAACLVVVLIVQLVSGPQSPRLTPTPSPSPTPPQPTAMPSPTIATPAPVITPEPTVFTLLRDGSEGEGVVRVQERLIELGYLRGEADGKYGRATGLAVQAFQKAAGLDVDGITGQKTADALFSLSAPYAPVSTDAPTSAPTATEAPTETPAAGEAAP